MAELKNATANGSKTVAILLEREGSAAVPAHPHQLKKWGQSPFPGKRGQT